MRLAVVIPTYNEVDTIGLLVERLRALPLDPSVIVVDDASPDGTGAVVEALARADGRLTLLRRSGKLGLGTAYREGIARARELGADLVATMDADLSHDPAYLPAIVAAAEKDDGIALGSRYVRGGSSCYGVLRSLLSRAANLATRLAIGDFALRDATAGYRCYARSAIDRIDWRAITSEGYSFQVEVVAMARSLGIPIAEVPISFRNRVAGSSKLSRRELAGGIVTLARIVARRAGARNGAAPGSHRTR